MKKRLILITLLVFLFLVSGVMAWGASTNVACVDDETGSSNTWVYSYNMGYVYYADYTQNMQTVEPGNVNAATLASFDTLFLFACDPSVFTVAQKADIVNFVKNGGKLIIWDSEDPYNPPPASSGWDYTWLPTPFATSVPGAQGALGTLTIVEENTLSSNNPASPYYINASYLSTQTDAVGDANVFTNFVPLHWCVDCTALNTLNIEGPVHVYSNTNLGKVGCGIIMYNGLDWNYAGFTSGWPAGTGAYYLKKFLKQEMDTSWLPCSNTIIPLLTVDKVTDKPAYNLNDPITFSITVTNPTAYTVEDVVLTEYPPPEVTLSQTVYNLGDIGPGSSVNIPITGTVTGVPADCVAENEVTVVGYYDGVPLFTGGDVVSFIIGTCVPSPEFPTLVIPATTIVGLLAVVSFLRRKDS